MSETKLQACSLVVIDHLSSSHPSIPPCSALPLDLPPSVNLQGLHAREIIHNRRNVQSLGLFQRIHQQLLSNSFQFYKRHSSQKYEYVFNPQPFKGKTSIIYKGINNKCVYPWETNQGFEKPCQLLIFVIQLHIFKVYMEKHRKARWLGAVITIMLLLQEFTDLGFTMTCETFGNLHANRNHPHNTMLPSSCFTKRTVFSK